MTSRRRTAAESRPAGSDAASQTLPGTPTALRERVSDTLNGLSDGRQETEAEVHAGERSGPNSGEVAILASRKGHREEAQPKRVTRSRTGEPTGGGHLTLAQLCADLGISRSTFYDWRAKKRAPRCIKLPNGDLRIRRTDYESWLDSLAEDAA